MRAQPGTAKPEASGLRPTDVVSQLDVVRLLAERKDKLNKVMGKTLEELEIFEVGCKACVQLQPPPCVVVQLSGNSSNVCIWVFNLWPCNDAGYRQGRLRWQSVARTRVGS